MTEPVWFSRLTLKRAAAAVAPLIGTLAPEDGGEAMAVGHQLMWSVMPDHVRTQRNASASGRRSAFLWREDETRGKYYLLGPRPVEESPYFEIETRPYSLALAPGDRLAFDLRLNATVERKIGALTDGRAKRQRADVAMDLLKSQEREGIGDRAQRAGRRLVAASVAAETWFKTIGERDGFRVLGLRLEAYHLETLPRRGTRAARFGVSDLAGLIEIVEPAAFAARVMRGFGRAKAFGCGLMLLRRASS